MLYEVWLQLQGPQFDPELRVTVCMEILMLSTWDSSEFYQKTGNRYLCVRSGTALIVPATAYP